MQAAQVSPQACWTYLCRKPSRQLHLSQRSVADLCGPANGARRRRKPAKENIMRARGRVDKKGIGGEGRRAAPPAHGVAVRLRSAGDGR
jgi:hypothetical protein